MLHCNCLLFIYITIKSCYDSILSGLSYLCHSWRFACQQRVLKTFPGPGYLRDENGVVWLWHFLVYLLECKFLTKCKCEIEHDQNSYAFLEGKSLCISLLRRLLRKFEKSVCQNELKRFIFLRFEFYSKCWSRNKCNKKRLQLSNCIVLPNSFLVNVPVCFSSFQWMLQSNGKHWNKWEHGNEVGWPWANSA